MLNEFDKHQLILIKNKILGFQENEVDLNALLSITSSLEEILKSLKNVDKQLIEKLTTEWWELELLSSVMIDEEDDMIDGESKQNIFFALEDMKKMIDTTLDHGS